MSNRQKPKWTIMVYLAGDNDLTSHCVSILQQLEAVRYRNDVCVLACFESSTPWPRGSRYIEVNCPHSEHKREANGFDWQLHNDLIPPAEAGQEKAPFNGKPLRRPAVAEGLRKFIDWSVHNHRDSEHYMLILFGHGPIVAGQSFLVSENPGSFLRLEDLKGVLNTRFGGEGRKRKKLDILAFQNCVMNGIETAYEIRHHADYVIGSQGLVLASGWPYDKMIETVVKTRSDALPASIAEKMLKVCARHMLDFTIMDRSSEQSACNLSELRNKDTITPALAKLVKALKEGLRIKDEEGEEEKGKEKRSLAYPEIANAVKLARLEAQSYWWEMHVDLYDFCERLIQKCDDLVKDQDRLLVKLKIQEKAKAKARARLANTPSVRKAKAIVAACIEVMEEIRELVPSTHSYYIGSALQYSHGLSIYFPWSEPVGPYFPKALRSGREFQLDTAFHTYKKYSFVRDSGWGSFLRLFFRATLRNMRRANRRFEMAENLANFEEGMVLAHYDNAAPVPGASDLQKSSPDTARADFDMSFNIKNYPRRNYLSPADEKRRIDQQKESEFEDPTAPPVSPFGWNFPKLLAEVIAKPRRKRPRNGNGSGSHASVSNGDSNSDSPTPFEQVAARKSSRNGPHKVGAGNPLAKVASSRRIT
jgi:hypothetical protein